jgi:hypothetical protein
VTLVAETPVVVVVSAMVIAAPAGTWAMLPFVKVGVIITGLPVVLIAVPMVPFTRGPEIEPTLPA